MSHLVLILHFAGGLLFWPAFGIGHRGHHPASRQLFTVFIATLAVLGVTAGSVAAIDNPAHWGSPLFSVINFGSVLCSWTAWIRKDPGLQKRLLEPRAAAALSVCFVVTAMMFVFGFRSIDILLNEARTTATVTGCHRGISYQFEAGGHTWTGGGDPGNPPYPIGSRFEIRYSAAHPFFSTASSPFDFLGEMAIGAAFVGFGAFSIRRHAIKRQASRTPVVSIGPQMKSQ